MKLTYKNAGVDIDAGNQLVERIRDAVKSTTRPEVLSGLGGFGALFKMPDKTYQEPVLVSGTDGVGTKLKLAQRLGIHHTIGIDLVAMCVNDVLVQGAEPLFFLDYFATGKLQVETAAAVIEGIAEGCRQSSAALIGGETAEMPGMYADEEYDLAGFCVGIVDRCNLLDGSRVQAGDRIIGIQSSGLHSNGFSLINALLDQKRYDLEQPIGDNITLGEALLAPTRIYVKLIHSLLKEIEIHALCHITGGGLTENIPRILAPGTDAKINLNSWQAPVIFDWLNRQQQVDESEMLRVFNCGIGMTVIVPAEQADETVATLTKNDAAAFDIGEVVTGSQSPKVLYNA